MGRSHLSGDHQIEGTGVGLAIAKSLVELVKGKIELKSTVGQGSCFSVIMPKGTVVEVNPGSESDSKDELDTDRINHDCDLLYIEDQEENVHLVLKIIKHRSKIRLLSAPNGKIGLEYTKDLKPDLILLDIHLPDMDGLAVFKKLKCMKCISMIPVIALSAASMKEDINKALEVGFNGYITKPIDIKSFLKLQDERLGS